MKLIILLGNPGSEYEKTRHNAGFIFGEYLRKKWNGEMWHEEKKFSGEISLSTIPRDDEMGHFRIVLLKPKTFMNKSGDSVSKVINFFQIHLENLIVIHDDKDLPFGEARFREKGGTGGHNGLLSIVSHLKTEEFARIKIGIETRPEDTKMDTSDFVLSKFTKEELEKLEKEIFPEVEKRLLSWIGEN